MVIEAVVHRLLPVIAHAIAVFGDEHKAADWFETPLPLLDNRPPSKLLETEEGTFQIEQILTRIEHNIPSWMLRLHRVCRARYANLDGKGAMIAGGRWNSPSPVRSPASDQHNSKIV